MSRTPGFTPSSLSVLLPIRDLTPSHFITLVQTDLLIVSTRPSFMVSLNLTLSLSLLIALSPRLGSLDERDGVSHGRMRSTRKRCAPQNRKHGIRFSLRRSMHKPVIVLGDAIRSARRCARSVLCSSEERSPARPLTIRFMDSVREVLCPTYIVDRWRNQLDAGTPLNLFKTHRTRR